LGIDVEVKSIDNPRKEAEDHYYNPVHTGLLDLGLEPHFMTPEVVVDLLRRIQSQAHRIDSAKIMPRVRWR